MTGNVIDLIGGRESVFYSVNIEQTWDGKIGISISGLGDNPSPRSRESVVAALKTAIELIEGSA